MAFGGMEPGAQAVVPCRVSIDSNRGTLELVCAEAFATGLDRFAHTPSRKSFFFLFLFNYW